MTLGPIMLSLRGTALAADEREWLASPLVGGVILFSRNYAGVEQLRALVDAIHALRQPPLLIAVDHEGGRVQRFRAPFTAVPAMRQLGHLFDRDAGAGDAAAHAVGWVIGAELRAFDIDLAFTPVVDLDLGISDVIGDRALHADPAVVARLAQRIVEGLGEAGMRATAKHFPTHAGALADSHTGLASDPRDYDALGADLEPWPRLIRAGLSSVMVGHVRFPALDPVPASLSRWWIEDELRGTLGFGGAIVSDDISMAGAAPGGRIADRAAAALEAGCDLVLVCNVPDEMPAVLERLRGYEDPAAQLRLMRLRGGHHDGWEALCASARHRRLRQVVRNIAEPPTLELEG